MPPKKSRRAAPECFKAQNLAAESRRRKRDYFGAETGEAGRVVAVISVLFIPGRGTNMKTPAIRVRVRRKPKSVEFERRSSLPIAAQVPKDQDCVRGHLLQHCIIILTTGFFG